MSDNSYKARYTYTQRSSCLASARPSRSLADLDITSKVTKPFQDLFESVTYRLELQTRYDSLLPFPLCHSASASYVELVIIPAP